MRHISPLVFIGAAVASAGMAETRDYVFDGFDEISVAEGIAADITIGAPFSIVAEARSEKILDELQLTVRNGTLRIERDLTLMDRFFGSLEEITVTITLPNLEALTATSGADVAVTGTFGDRFDADVSSGADIHLAGVMSNRVDLDASSGGSITVDGRCQDLTLDVSSGSDIDAKFLECQSVAVDASSGSDAIVFATEQIKTDVSSGADVTVWGTPAHSNIEVSSGGDTLLRERNP